MKAIAIVLGAALTLAACQKSATVRESLGAGFVQLSGSYVVLKQPLNVPAGRARVFIQAGAVDGTSRVLSGGFDHYRPHCAFEIRRVDHGGFTIQPDSFLITQVQGSLERVVRAERVQLAGLWNAGLGLDGGGSSAYHEGYHFWLASERQPEVRRMSCYGVYAEPYDLEPPTLSEVREALGEIAEIRR